MLYVNLIIPDFVIVTIASPICNLLICKYFIKTYMYIYKLFNNNLKVTSSQILQFVINATKICKYLKGTNLLMNNLNLI